MKYITKKLFTGLISLTTVAGFLFINPQAMFAATTAHVQIVGSQQTIWYGDISTDGCTVTDTTNVAHTYTQPFAVCALDAASKIGGFTYQVKDFGGSLGLFLQNVAGDTGAADFSTYWSYDINGTSAQNGISSQLVNNGDKLKFSFVDPNADINQRVVNDAITYLRSQQASDGSIQGYTGVTPWAIMAFVSANVDPGTVSKSGNSVLDYVTANPPTDSSTVTDWEKAILAITAASKSPYDFGGVNYEAKLETFYNNGQIGNTTLLNDDVFGLLALVASGDNASSSLKQNVTAFLINHQLPDGSFNYSTTGTTGDVDDTASTLQALVAAQNHGIATTGLSTAITKATTYLVNAQRSNGGFSYSLTDTDPNSSSTAWASMALSAVGGNDSAIGKAKTFLQSNQEENGSFHWQPSSSGETFTTSYVVPALEGKSWPLHVFTGTITVTPTPSPTASVTPSPTVTLTVTPSVTPTSSPAPTITVTPTVTPSPTESPTPTVTMSPTVTPTQIPSVTPTPSQVVLSATPTMTVSPTPGKGDNKDLKKHQEQMLIFVRRQQKEIEQEIHHLEERNRVIYAQISAECNRLIHSMNLFFKI